MTTVSHAPGRHHDVRGHQLWTETEGSGEPLLLAGFGPAGSHVIFHPFFTGVAGTFQVIYADLSGITFAGDVADVAALIGELGLGPVHVYGFSYRFCSPDNATLLPDEPGARNTELYPVFAGADVDFIIGGEIARIPDFRPRLKEISVPVMVLAVRHDRALYPAMQRQFTEFGPQIRLEFLERSGSFSHIEEPEAVFGLLRDFTGRP